MHYGNLVIVKESEAEANLDAAIEEAMGPHEDNGGFWDWYQIGGRWTGTFDGYDPNTDPANIEVCSLCAGTGTRTDMVVANGCNGCSGNGKRSVWPTQYKQHSGDVKPVSELTEENLSKFYRFILPDGYGHYESERYEPWQETDKFPKQSMPTLEWIKKNFGYGYVAVIVDSHC